PMKLKPAAMLIFYAGAVPAVRSAVRRWGWQILCAMMLSVMVVPAYGLTLDEAMKIVLERHPLIASGDYEVKQAEAAKGEAFGALLPAMTVSGDAANQQYEFTDRSNG